MTIVPTRALALAAFSVAACAPTHDWREVRPPESGIVALFPCKPEQLMRTVTIVGAPTPMRLTACKAGDATFALGYARVDEPAKVGAALAQLRGAAVANIAGEASAPQAFVVAGMTPHAAAQRWTLQGRGADGKAVSEQVAVFARGLTVFQATIVGPRIDADAVDTFFTGLKFPA